MKTRIKFYLVITVLLTISLSCSKSGSGNGDSDPGNGDADECIPKTCVELNYNCGNVDNGCGTILDCGDCEADSDCVDGVCLSKNFTTNISQYNITWHFEEPVEYGTFVNGDYWVVGPVNIKRITPESIVGDGIISTEFSFGGTWIPAMGRIVHGSMINPNPTSSETGYDSASPYQIYNTLLNVARPNGHDLSETNLLTVQPGSSLISTYSADYLGTDYPVEDENLIRMEAAAILTVLEASPSAGSFRPWYSGSDKQISFNKSDVNFELLKELNVTGIDHLPDFKKGLGDNGMSDNFYQGDTLERSIERPWIDHYPHWSGEYSIPVLNRRRYGRDVLQQVGEIILALNLDWSGSNSFTTNNNYKEKLLISTIQAGIDYYGLYENGAVEHWENDGGHGNGRKFLIAFAGTLLDDANSISNDMKNIGLHDFGDPRFSEDDQTFYVNQDVLSVQDQTFTDSEGTRSWADPEGVCGEKTSCTGNCGPDYRDDYDIKYSESDLGLPEWCIRGGDKTWSCNRLWGTVYRSSQTSSQYVGTALALHIMNLTQTWNHPAFLDYVDRFYKIDSYIREESIKNGWTARTRAVIDPPFEYNIDGHPETDVHGNSVAESFERYFLDSYAFSNEMWELYRNDFNCTYTGLNTTTHKRIYNCIDESIDCSNISSCLNYPNQRAIDYDPCDVCD